MLHRSVLYRLAVFSALCLAATAAQARASTFCVADPACVADGHHDSGANLADGIADAAANAGDDTVRVGPGSFKGPFAYTAPGDLTLVGAGAATVLYLPPGTAGATLLSLNHSSVASLRLMIGAGEGNIGTRLVRSSATDVAIEFAAGSTSSVGVNLTGGSLHDIRVSAPFDAGSAAVWADTLPFLISGSELRSEHGVVSSSPLGASRIDATRIDARFAVMHQCGELVVDDTLIRGDRVMHAAWARDVSCAGDTELTLRHTTIVGAGNPESTGVLAQAVGAGNKTTVRVANSIVDGVGHALSRHAVTGARASLVADWSSWAPGGVVSENLTGGTGALIALERVAGAPVFVDPSAGDFRLQAGSPMVDAGEPLALQPGEPSRDLAGRPRIAARLEGGVPRRDLGAFERPTAPAPAPAPPEVPAPVPAQPEAPAPAATPLAQGDAPGLALSLSAAGRQRALRDGVVLVARSQTAVTLRATASLQIAGRRGSVRLRPATTAQIAAGASRLVVRVPARHRTLVKRALAARERVTVTLRVTATAPDGRTASATHRVRVAL